jgi:hypothetical protein
MDKEYKVVKLKYPGIDDRYTTLATFNKNEDALKFVDTYSNEMNVAKNMLAVYEEDKREPVTIGESIIRIGISAIMGAIVGEAFQWLFIGEPSMAAGVLSIFCSALFYYMFYYAE